MYCKYIVKYNSPYLYLPSVFIKPEIYIFNSNVTPLHMQVHNEQCTFYTVSCEQQILNLGPCSLEVSSPFYCSSQVGERIP